MTKLSKVQKERAALIGLTATILALVLWQMVIAPTQQSLQTKQQLLADWQQANREGKNQTDLLARLNREFEETSEKIRRCEATIASGDPYRWLMKTLPSFYEADPVDLMNYDPPQASDWQIFPRVPYRAVTFTASGAGYYEDLGKLLKVLENSHPWVRLKRLDLEPKHSAEAGDEEDEKLNFRLEFVCMLKTNSPSAEPPTPQRYTSRKP